MSDRRTPREPDYTRRRLIVGMSALGAGALGVVSIKGLLGGAPNTTVPPEDTGAVAPPSTVRAAASSTTTIKASTTTSDDVSTTVAATPVKVACRDAWGAAAAGAGLIEHDPIRLTIHHTAVQQTELRQGPARARQHQQYHQSLGWPDLAYHFLVDRSGLAYEGRDLRFRGDTGTEYDPTGHFLVCMEGDFDAQEPTPAQIGTTVALFAWASQRYGIDAETLAGHGSYADTSCPGASVTARLPEIRSAIGRTGPVNLELICGDDGADLVAALEAG